jgi:hypothetical protein
MMAIYWESSLCVTLPEPRQSLLQCSTRSGPTTPSGLRTCLDSIPNVFVRALIALSSSGILLKEYWLHLVTRKMAIRPDISVYSPDNRLQLVVEVKNKPESSPEWAAQMRRNLVRHSGFAGVPFFMVAVSDWLYFWKDGTATDDRLPDLQLSTREVLQDYFVGWDLSTREFTESSLELMLIAWLTDLASAYRGRDSQPALSWLFDSGLVDSVRRGVVRAGDEAA